MPRKRSKSRSRSRARSRSKPARSVHWGGADETKHYTIVDCNSLKDVGEHTYKGKSPYQAGRKIARRLLRKSGKTEVTFCVRQKSRENEKKSIFKYKATGKMVMPTDKWTKEHFGNKKLLKISLKSIGKQNKKSKGGKKKVSHAEETSSSD